MSKVCMNLIMVQSFIFFIVVIMLETNIYCHHVYGFALLNFKCLVNSFISFEIRGFVHVEPNS